MFLKCSIISGPFKTILMKRILLLYSSHIEQNGNWPTNQQKNFQDCGEDLESQVIAIQSWWSEFRIHRNARQRQSEGPVISVPSNQKMGYRDRKTIIISQSCLARVYSCKQWERYYLKAENEDLQQALSSDIHIQWYMHTHPPSSPHTHGVWGFGQE